MQRWFTKTGSGQHTLARIKQEGISLRFVSFRFTQRYTTRWTQQLSLRLGSTSARLCRWTSVASQASVCAILLSHLYIKTIILPRQARDKHRENSKKKTPFSAPGERLRDYYAASQADIEGTAEPALTEVEVAALEELVQWDGRMVRGKHEMVSLLLIYYIVAILYR
eukprot:COSAG06_NODE_289_length_18231_cov_20.202515_18_plen_167_part_00